MKLNYISTAAIMGRTAEYAFVDSRFGLTILATCDGAICYMLFAKSKGEGMARLERYWKGGRLIPAKDGQKALGEKIFSGKTDDLSVMLAGTEFQHKVWKALAKVQHGKTISYGRPSGENWHAESGARRRHNALGANPVVYLLACHRVLGAAGNLNGFGCGLPVKQKLLSAEGHGKTGSVMFPVNLETERLILRELTLDNMLAIQLYAADPEVVKVS